MAITAVEVRIVDTTGASPLCLVPRSSLQSPWIRLACSEFTERSDFNAKYTLNPLGLARYVCNPRGFVLLAPRSLNGSDFNAKYTLCPLGLARYDLPDTGQGVEYL